MANRMWKKDLATGIDISANQSKFNILSLQEIIGFDYYQPDHRQDLIIFYLHTVW